MDSLHKRPERRKFSPQPLASPKAVELPGSFRHTPTTSLPATGSKFSTHKYHPQSPKLPRTGLRRFFRISFILVGCAVIGSGLVLAWKANQAAERIYIRNVPRDAPIQEIRSLASSFLDDERVPLAGEAEERINILLLGRAGERHPGKNLTDTIMVMSLDTEQRKVALLSLPRDLYVTLPDRSFSTKLNSVYQHSLEKTGGPELVQAVVENITGLTLHYSFIIDFDGFEQAINAIHGITVDVPRDFYDPRYPGPNRSYQTFELKKGWQTLDGQTALQYVRERHNDPEGDFGRAKRQQQVLQAVRDKAFSLGTLLNPFVAAKLLDTLSQHVETDIRPEEIESFIGLTRRLDTRNVETVVVDAWKADSLLKVSHVWTGPNQSIRMFILVPRVGNWNEVRDMASNLFDLEAVRQREAEMEREAATLVVIDQSEKHYGGAVVRLLRERLGFNHATLVTPSATHSSPTSSLTQSFIVDHTGRNKPWTLDELLKKLPLQLESDAAAAAAFGILDTTADFTLVIGDDFEVLFDYAEDSREDFEKSNQDMEYQYLLEDTSHL